jgi:propanol-preferring alcohol dehydrogenase
MLVPAARLLVPLGDLSPTKAAPLSDAALTPYHAIKRALPQINAESTVVVMGVGGLGHMAIQLLRVLTPVRIIATDVDEKKLNHAKALGADETVNNRNADEGRRADTENHRAARRGAGARLRGRATDHQSRREASGAQLRLDHRRARWRPPRLSSRQHALRLLGKYPYWGSRVELMEVIATVRDGRIHAETTEYPLDQAIEVYDKLKAGQITDRAVLIPDGP